MRNPLIFHADRELNHSGWTTLRFNFRGAGASEGAHDEGKGEVGDVGAAVSWLREMAPELPLLLVGYSFGSWCAIRYAVDDLAVAALVAVGLPVRVYGLEEIARLLRPLAVVQGSADEFGGPSEVRAVLDRARPPGELTVVPGASHLFPGTVLEAASAVRLAAERCLARVSRFSP
jgi:alpha/beta superfamily hydrolase